MKKAKPLDVIEKCKKKLMQFISLDMVISFKFRFEKIHYLNKNHCCNYESAVNLANFRNVKENRN